jgi:hypothetical protein
MEKIFNGIFILLILLMCAAILKYIYNCNNSEGFAVNLSNQIDTIKLNNLTFNPTIDKQPIKFNYDLNSKMNKQFQKEQETGAFIYPNYPNQSIPNEIIQPTTGSSYDFNKLKTENLDGQLTNEISIKDVYDNSLVDYKKLIPAKTKQLSTIKEAASDLKFHSDNMWEYDNDKPENGGKITNDEKYELFAFDNNNNVASIF